MKHILALIIKFAMIAVVLEAVLLTLTDMTVLDILYLSLAVTAIAYVVGDLFILDKTNNTVATIADIGLALVAIWAVSYFYRFTGISFTDALIAAGAVGVGEWIYHKYVRAAVFPPVEKA